MPAARLPWTECIDRYDRPHTFFYCDPPYWQTEGYGVPFPFEEYETLAHRMKNMKGKAMLSINDHSDIRKAFDGLPMLNLEIKYAVASTHGAPRTSQELVITNWEPGTNSGGLF